MSTPALHILIDNYLNDQDAVAKSKATYRRGLLIWIKYCQVNQIDILNAKRNDVINYKSSLKAKGLTILTIDNYLTALRKWYKWLVDNGYARQDIAKDIRLYKKTTDLRRMPLMPEQVKLLLSQPDTSTTIGKRDYAMMRLMLDTALRCVEISRLTIKDLTATNNGYSLNILRKGRDQKEVKMISNSVFDDIEAYLKDRKNLLDDDVLFAACSINRNEKFLSEKAVGKVIKKYLSLTQLDSRMYTAHSLRHTVAVTLINEGIPMYDVQLFLGHKSPAMTQVYLRYVEEQKRLNTTLNSVLEGVFNIKNK